MEFEFTPDNCALCWLDCIVYLADVGNSLHRTYDRRLDFQGQDEGLVFPQPCVIPPFYTIIFVVRRWSWPISVSRCLVLLARVGIMLTSLFY